MNTTQRKPENFIKSELAERLASRCIKSKCDASLKKLSTFSIGGKCHIAVFPKNLSELTYAIELAEEFNVPFEVIGRGSNVLFLDCGYNGMLIFTSYMRQIYFNSNGFIRAEAGANLTSLSLKASAKGLSGLEFACGIPGSCGGAVYMNAGAYGGEISKVLEYSEYYDIVQKKIVRLSHSEHNFSYRQSIYTNNKNMIITEAGFQLTRGDVNEIKARMNEYTEKRHNSQPHEYPNAGSIFKRPENGYAAKMIDECGLKGLTVGGAQVSEKHAGFIVNKGNASSDDVLRLIETVRSRVYESFGVDLECEIRIIK